MVFHICTAAGKLGLRSEQVSDEKGKFSLFSPHWSDHCLDFSVHRPSTSLSMTANDEAALAMLEDMIVAVPLFVSKLEEASS